MLTLASKPYCAPRWTSIPKSLSIRSGRYHRSSDEGVLQSADGTIVETCLQSRYWYGVFLMNTGAMRTSINTSSHRVRIASSRIRDDCTASYCPFHPIESYQLYHIEWRQTNNTDRSSIITVPMYNCYAAYAVLVKKNPCTCLLTDAILQGCIFIMVTQIVRKTPTWSERCTWIMWVHWVCTQAHAHDSRHYLLKLLELTGVITVSLGHCDRYTSFD